MFLGDKTYHNARLVRACLPDFQTQLQLPEGMWEAARTALLAERPAFDFGKEVVEDVSRPSRSQSPLSKKETIDLLGPLERACSDYLLSMLPLHAGHRYLLGFVSVFHDPVGSSRQHFHVDIPGIETGVPIWSLAFPLMPMSEGHVLAESAFAPAKSYSPQGIGDAILWDLNALHRGRGNDGSEPMAHLQLVYFPEWTICDDPDFGKVNRKQVFRARMGIATEYNGNRPVFDATSPVGQWVQYHAPQA